MGLSKERFEWVHAKTGLHCEVCLNLFSPTRLWRWKQWMLTGASSPSSSLTEWWCGYVTIPDPSALTEEEALSFDVHGGVSYHSKGTIGFDCNHYGDRKVPWTKERAMAETERLAVQIGARIGLLVLLLDGIQKEDG